MKADDWTSPATVFCLKHGHDGEVTDMQRTTYSARCAAGVPSGASRGAGPDNSVRARDYQV